MQGSLGLKSINDLQASFYKLVNTHLIIQSTSTDKQQQIEFDNTSDYSDIKHFYYSHIHKPLKVIELRQCYLSRPWIICLVIILLIFNFESSNNAEIFH